MKQEKDILLFQKIAVIIIRFRWLAMIGVLLLTAFFVMQSSALKFNGSFEIWFLDNDSAMQRLNSFKETFGNDQFVYILAETDGVFTPEIATPLQQLTKDLEQNVPYLRDLTWVGNAEHIAAEGSTVLIQELLEDIPHDKTELERRRKLALSEQDFVNRYISQDGKAAGIMLELENYPDTSVFPPPSTQVATAVFTVLEKPEYANIKLHVVGGPIFETRYNEIAGKETPKFFGLCILIQAILLMIFARGGRGIIVPIIIVTLSFLWTLGTIGLLGFDLDLMIIGLPVLLVCVGIGDAMHAIADFNEKFRQGHSRQEALIRSIGDVGLPCLLTSLTTAIGFFAFSSAPIKPFLQMGMYLPAGVIYAFILTIVLVPAIYSFGGNKAKSQKKKPKISELTQRLLEKMGKLTTSYPGATCAVFSCLMLLGVAGAFLVQVESNPTKFLTKRVQLRQDIDYVDNRLGGSTNLEIVIDTQKNDGIKNLAVLHSMDKLSATMKEDPLVNKTFSLVDVLKKMRCALHEGQKEYYALPAQPKAVPEYMALYEMAGGDQMDKIVSFDGAKARINLQTKALGSADTRRLMSQVDELSKQYFSQGIQVVTTGFVDIAKTLNDNMGTAQSRSIALAFCMITVVMMVALKSIRLGIISMVPNIMPVFMVLGLLGYTGIYMDTILMSVSAMIIGVAVDDTIHFFIHFRREFDQYGTYAEATKATLQAVGRPIMFTTFTLSLGFLVLACSVMVGWIKIGLLAGFAFSWALAADLLFAPALLIILKPLGPERITPKDTVYNTVTT